MSGLLHVKNKNYLYRFHLKHLKFMQDGITYGTYETENKMTTICQKIDSLYNDVLYAICSFTFSCDPFLKFFVFLNLCPKLEFLYVPCHLTWHWVCFSICHLYSLFVLYCKMLGGMTMLQLGTKEQNCPVLCTPGLDVCAGTW